MGLFDRFKKDKAKNEDMKSSLVNLNEAQVELSSFSTRNGTSYTLIEYYDPTADFKQFYNKTCLCVKNEPKRLENGALIYEGAVEWRNESDCDMWRNQEERMEEFMKPIQLGLNMEKMCTDKEYQKVLMEELLKKSRVERYLQNGLEDYPQDYPSGNYVGQVGMDMQRGRYVKQFDPRVGEMIHNSKEQAEARKKFKDERAQAKARAIEKRKAEIERLKAEIDELEQ